MTPETCSECPIFKQGGCEGQDGDPSTCKTLKQYEAYLPAPKKAEIAPTKPASSAVRGSPYPPASTHSSRVADKY